MLKSEFSFTKLTEKNMSSPKETQPNIKYAEGKIDRAQLEFMKIVEAQNLERVTKLKRTRRNNLVTAAVLGGTVLGIYAYSMLSIQQEKFLDDFEEPKKVQN